MSRSRSGEPTRTSRTGDSKIGLEKRERRSGLGDSNLTRLEPRRRLGGSGSEKMWGQQAARIGWVTAAVRDNRTAQNSGGGEAPMSGGGRRRLLPFLDGIGGRGFC